MDDREPRARCQRGTRLRPWAHHFGGRALAAPSVELRPVRPTDRERIEEMVADVWNGHDYLPRVFNAWVSDPGAWFQAAEVDGEVVGVQRLRPIGPRLLWYEGLRVDPRHRRRGLARAMLTAAAAQGRGLGFEEMRLATGSPDAVPLFETAGFRLLVAVRLWRATRLEGDEPARMPGPADAVRLARIIGEDPARELYGGVIPDGEWALDIDAELLARLAGEGRLRVAGGGRALAAVRPGWGGDRLWASFASGSGGALGELLRALRFEADADGMEGVSLWAPDGHPGEEDFTSSGYDSDADPFRIHYFALRLET